MKQFRLLFDGSTADGNPGKGGCGCIGYMQDDDNLQPGFIRPSTAENKKKEELLFRESRTLGNVTSNEAEYHGLIVGLRHIVNDYPITEYNVRVCGDSELVIKQMRGECNVHSPNLQLLYIVAKGLVKRVKGDVTFEHVRRDLNEEADSLAKKATKASPKQGEFLVFYPSRMSLSDAELNGKRLIAGNDCGAAARTPEILFDATTIVKMMGEKTLTSLIDPGKTSFVRGKSDMTILGILRDPVTMKVDLGCGLKEITIDDGIVVDALPYDVQISMDHPAMKNYGGWRMGSHIGHKFGVSSLPERFHGHPFWKEDRNQFCAIGFGHS